MKNSKSNKSLVDRLALRGDGGRSATRPTILASLLLLFHFAFFILNCPAAQTNTLYFPIADIGQSGKTNVRVTLTLLKPNPRIYNGLGIRQDPIWTNTLADATAYFTNILWGNYRVDVAGVGTSFPIFVGTNTLGLVNGWTCYTNAAAVPPDDSTLYYTKAQVDALIAGVDGGGSGTFDYTALSNAPDAAASWWVSFPFVGENKSLGGLGEDIYLALSGDGTNWYFANGSNYLWRDQNYFTNANTGPNARNCDIVRSANGKWYMHYNDHERSTNAIDRVRFVLLESLDLKRWQFSRFLTNSPSGNANESAWASQFFKDDDGTIWVMVPYGTNGIQGSHDIYASRALNDTLSSWTTPVRIWTNAYDPAVIRDGNTLRLWVVSYSGTPEQALTNSAMTNFFQPNGGQTFGAAEPDFPTEGQMVMRLSGTHLRAYGEIHSSGLYLSESTNNGVNWSGWFAAGGSAASAWRHGAVLFVPYFEPPGDIITNGFTLMDGRGITNLASGSSAWGGITGTLSSQTDLQSALDAKDSITQRVAATNDLNTVLRALFAVALTNNETRLAHFGGGLYLQTNATAQWTVERTGDNLFINELVGGKDFQFLSTGVLAANAFSGAALTVSGNTTLSGLTASRGVFTDGSKVLTSATASGAVPLNADGTASTAAQVGALFPGAILTNGGSFVATWSNHMIWQDAAGNYAVISNGVANLASLTNRGIASIGGILVVGSSIQGPAGGLALGNGIGSGSITIDTSDFRPTTDGAMALGRPTHRLSAIYLLVAPSQSTNGIVANPVAGRMYSTNGAAAITFGAFASVPTAHYIKSIITVSNTTAATPFQVIFPGGTRATNGVPATFDVQGSTEAIFEVHHNAQRSTNVVRVF